MTSILRFWLICLGCTRASVGHKCSSGDINIQHGLQNTELGDYFSEIYFLAIQFHILPWEHLQLHLWTFFICLGPIWVASPSLQTQFFLFPSPDVFLYLLLLPSLHLLRSQIMSGFGFLPCCFLWDSSDHSHSKTSVPKPLSLLGRREGTEDWGKRWWISARICGCENYKKLIII